MKNRCALLLPLLALSLSHPALSATSTPAIGISVQPPFGGTVAKGAPVASVAAGQMATVALVVRAPAEATVKVALAGDLKSPKSKLPPAKSTLRPIGQCAPFGAAKDAAVPAVVDEAKRVYWLRVSVPRGQAAGRYRGVARATATLPGSTAPLRADGAVDIEVLPFDLIGASRQYAWIGASGWESPDGLLARLKEVGVLTVGIATPADALWPALEQCRAQGARGVVPYAPPTDADRARVEELEAARREKQLPPVVWLFGTDQTSEAVRVGGLGIPVGAVIASGDPLPEPPVDTIVRRVDADAVAGYLKTPIPAMQSPKPGEPPARRLVQWWSWDTASATPAQNRLFAGFLLWRAGFTGACVEEREGDLADLAALAHRYEAVRWGVDDVRHLTTYYGLLRQLRDKDKRHPMPDRAEAEVSAVLARLTPASSFASADFARRTLARWIGALRKEVG